MKLNVILFNMYPYPNSSTHFYNFVHFSQWLLSNHMKPELEITNINSVQSRRYRAGGRVQFVGIHSPKNGGLIVAPAYKVSTYRMAD